MTQGPNGEVPYVVPTTRASKTGPPTTATTPAGAPHPPRPNAPKRLARRGAEAPAAGMPAKRKRIDRERFASGAVLARPPPGWRAAGNCTRCAGEGAERTCSCTPTCTRQPETRTVSLHLHGNSRRAGRGRGRVALHAARAHGHGAPESMQACEPAGLGAAPLAMRAAHVRSYGSHLHRLEGGRRGGFACGRGAGKVDWGGLHAKPAGRLRAGGERHGRGTTWGLLKCIMTAGRGASRPENARAAPRQPRRRAHRGASAPGGRTRTWRAATSKTEQLSKPKL